MKIRKATPEDAKELSELRKETFKKINSLDYPKEHIAIFNKKNSISKIKQKMKETEMFCAIEKNEIIGTIYLRGDLIGGLYIKSDYIRKGFGTKLLNFVENYAKNKGIKKVKIYATKYGYPFYIFNKYTLVKKGFWTIKDSRVMNYNMEKEL